MLKKNKNLRDKNYHWKNWVGWIIIKFTNNFHEVALKIKTDWTTEWLSKFEN